MTSHPQPASFLLVADYLHPLGNKLANPQCAGIVALCLITCASLIILAPRTNSYAPLSAVTHQ